VEATASEAVTCREAAAETGMHSVAAPEVPGDTTDRACVPAAAVVPPA
jgi:hypothetical protein